MATEKRLIDANALDEKLDTLMIRYKALGRDLVVEDYNFVRTVLLTAPTVDAVEVIRCRDCICWQPEFGVCGRYCTSKPGNGYCDMGKRRNDA